ncbi:hypothetical protein RJ639_020166 [Escallonia herrerae]|uniref:Myb/SANT-like domain-containing protein n=1 Tax=Escallonia herrerae TaxID=1293975 RepID=A0AA88V846_9ASTE|nr:hypothetical protein RJ639_020166 [Escallonia herrerae]
MGWWWPWLVKVDKVAGGGDSGSCDIGGYGGRGCGYGGVVVVDGANGNGGSGATVPPDMRPSSWSREMDKALSTFLIGQMKQGNKSGEDWKPEVYFEAVEHLNSAFDLDLTRDKIKYRVKTWQRYYTVIMDVKASQYGFSWNDEEKRIVMTMAEYAAWSTYVKDCCNVYVNGLHLTKSYGQRLDQAC